MEVGILRDFPFHFVIYLHLLPYWQSVHLSFTYACVMKLFLFILNVCTLLTALNCFMSAAYDSVDEVSWLCMSSVDHPRSGVLYNFASVCLSVCMSDNNAGSSYLHIRCIFREYGSSSYMKVIGSRLKSLEQKSGKSLFQQCKT